MTRRSAPPALYALTGIAALASLCALALLSGCSGDEEPDPQRGADAPNQNFDHVRFTDITAASGIAHVNVSGEAKNKMAIPENIGQGAAAIDYDGDGDLDLFLVNGDVFEGQVAASDTRCALFRNDGDGKFTDVTETAGLVFKGWAHGASAADFDGDGHTDLYVTCYLRENLFFRNTGKATFEDYSDRWGAADPGPSTASCFFDADGDGDLDLYVGNYVNYDPKAPPNHGKPCVWKGLKVSCGPTGTPKAADTFYENVDGKLTEATDKFGFTARPAYTLGLVSGDFDNDGDADLYVANDSVANYLFENVGKGQFKQMGFRYGVDMNGDGRAQAGMGVDFGDVDNDGRFEYFVTNFSHDYNTLYRNEQTEGGRAHFTDSTYAMDLGDTAYTYLSWGTRIVDVDSDGWQDLVVVSGHVYPQVDGANLGTSYRQHNQIFMNRGPGPADVVRFVMLENAKVPGWGKEACSRGLVTLDLDDDGDTDFFILEMDDKPTLLRNDTEPRNWVGIKLVGKGKNREAIGARVTVTDSRGTKRYRERCGGGSFLSSGDPRLLVGLGSAAGDVTIEVRWPSGETATHTGLGTGQYHVLNEN